MISGEAHAVDEMPEEGEVKSYMVCGEKVPAVFQKMGLNIQKKHINIQRLVELLLETKGY